MMIGAIPAAALRVAVAATLGVTLGATLAVASPAAAEVPASPRVFVDSLGHRLEWRTPPGRIVSLSPNLTEILFALGHDEETIAGRTRYCDHPAAAAAVPEVGGIVDPSLEAVVALRPDLVLATRGNTLEFMESLVRLAIPVYALETEGGLERVFETIVEIGAVTGREEAAATLSGDLRARLAQVVERTRGLAPRARPRVYYGEIEGACWTAGPGSFIDDLIRAAGGENVGAVSPAPWSAISFEEVIAADPQVYLGTFRGEGLEGGRERVLATLRSGAGWRRTSLGQSPRVFLVQEDRLQRPGPRIMDVLEEFARYLHPDLWIGDAEGAR